MVIFNCTYDYCKIIALDQVIDSAYRVADHLEKNEGREEESKLIREYFKKEPIQQAIEATAISRSTKVLKLIFLLTFKVRVFRCQISSHKMSIHLPKYFIIIYSR